MFRISLNPIVSKQSFSDEMSSLQTLLPLQCGNSTNCPIRYMTAPMSYIFHRLILQFNANRFTPISDSHAASFRQLYHLSWCRIAVQARCSGAVAHAAYTVGSNGLAVFASSVLGSAGLAHRHRAHLWHRLELSRQGTCAPGPLRYPRTH